MQASRFGLFRVRSPLLTESLFIFSSSGYLDVSVHRVPSVHLWIQCTVHEVFSCGFPHSDICGSQCICHSPQLFAAYHVFHRLSVPRHPSCALCDLTFRLVLTSHPETACCSFRDASRFFCSHSVGCRMIAFSSISSARACALIWSFLLLITVAVRRFQSTFAFGSVSWTAIA